MAKKIIAMTKDQLLEVIEKTGEQKKIRTGLGRKKL